MSLKEAVLRLIGRGAIRRWDQEELARRRTQLETRLQGAQQTASDAIELSEYLIQRYLPQDRPFTRQQWNNFRRKIVRSVTAADAAGELTPEASAARIAALNEERQARQRQVRSSYAMSGEDFETVVGRLLMEAGYRFPKHLLRRLYTATGRGRGCDDDIDDVHPGLIQVARFWRENYQLLRGARNADYRWIKVSPNYGCVCSADVGHQVHATEDMLRAFEGGGLDELVYPSPRLPCLRADSPRSCSPILHPADDPMLRIDPKFEEWLQDMADKRRRRS